MPENLKKEIEIMLFGDMVLEGEKQILTIEQFIKSKLAGGMGKKEVLELLRRDLFEGGQLFGDFRKNIKATQRNGIENFARIPLLEDSTGLFDWVGVGDNKICDDCLERNNMEPRTFQEWAAIGLPGEGATVCGKNCRCILMPADTLEKGKAVIRRKK